MSDEASSTTTWETIVQNYKTRAVRDGARIDELRQSTEHWHDTAQMLKRQRDTAEEERDGWKIRAMKAEQGRQAAKAEADHWKAAWALAVSEAPGVHAECEALRNIILWALGENGEFPERPWGVLHTPYPFYWWRTEMRKRLDAAMAVQPTTGETDAPDDAPEDELTDKEAEGLLLQIGKAISGTEGEHE